MKPMLLVVSLLLPLVSCYHGVREVTENRVETCKAECALYDMQLWGLNVVRGGARCICKVADTTAAKPGAPKRWYAPEGADCPVFEDHVECRQNTGKACKLRKGVMPSCK